MLNKIEQQVKQGQVTSRIWESSNEQSSENLSIKFVNGQWDWEGYFGIVEGYDDKEFYSNLKIFENVEFNPILPSKEEIDSSNSAIETLVDVYKKRGKDGVISSLDDFRMIPGLRSKLKKVIFIVDSDWEGPWMYKDVKERLNLTQGHSVEDYYLTKENVQNIFKLKCAEHKVVDADIYVADFEKRYENFKKEIWDYIRCKASLFVINSNHNEFHQYNEKYYIGENIDELLKDFDFNKYPEVGFDKQHLKEETNKLIRKIESREFLPVKKFYDRYSKDIASKRELIRGHQAWEFLEAYFRDVLNINIKKNDSDLIKCLDVDLKIKDGNGKIIK